MTAQLRISNAAKAYRAAKLKARELAKLEARKVYNEVYAREMKVAYQIYADSIAVKGGTRMSLADARLQESTLHNAIAEEFMDYNEEEYK